MNQIPNTKYQIPHNGNMNVAIVHDWLVGGGAERVVLELHRMFPDAPIYTSYASKEWQDKLDGKVITGYLQRWPFSKLRKYLPVLRARWFKRLDLSGYDLIISSKGNGEANYIRKPAGATHICYCHSPTHFYWRKYDEYIKSPGFGLFNPLARLGLRLLVRPLRRMDYEAAQKVDHFIANSSHIQKEIKKSYGRDSVVIHPPVDIERFANAKSKKRHGFVTVGRQVPYKRTDLIIEACNQLQLPLTVIGRGPQHARLKKLAEPTVSFVTDASDEQVAEALAGAKAFIFAADEDFGITPVEAMAAGTPVIAYRAGGALDYVIEGKTGLFYDEQSPASLVEALERFNNTSINTSVNSSIIRKHAAQFSAAAFISRIEAFLTENVAKP